MNITIQINTDNAAFEDGGEVARILSIVAEKIEDGICQFPIHDLNGNKVGQVKSV